MKIVGFHVSRSGVVRDVSELAVPLVLMLTVGFIPPLRWITWGCLRVHKIIRGY